MTVGRLRRVFFVSGAISRSEREGGDVRGEGDFTARNSAIVKAALGISVSKPVEIRQHIGPYRTKQRSKSHGPFTFRHQEILPDSRCLLYTSDAADE